MATKLGDAFIQISASMDGVQRDISKHLAGLGKIGESAGKDIGKAMSSEVEKAGKSFEKSGKAAGSGYAAQFAKEAQSSLGGLGDRLMGGIGKGMLAGAAVAGTAVAGTLGAAISKGFSRLTNIDQAESKLRGLGNSAEDVTAIMESANAAVKGTAFGLDEAATTAASAVAAGIKPGADLQRTLTLMGDAATIAGTDMSTMGSIVNKVATSDMMQMDVANQLMDAGIPILQMVAEEMGVTADEARKLASEGKVSFETFQNALEKGLGGAAQESGNTFQGAMANMGAAMGRFGATLAAPVFDNAPIIFGAIGDAFGLLQEKVGPLAEDFGEWLAPKIEDFAANLGPWLVSTVENIADAIGDMSRWLKDNAVWLKPVVAGLGTLAGVIGTAAVSISLWNKGMAVYKTVTAIATGQTLLFNNALKTNVIILVVSALAALVAGLVYFFTKTETGREMWEKFTTALADGWEWVKTTVFDAWTATTEAFSAGWTATTDAVTAAWTWLKDGLAAGWELIKTLVFDAFTFYIDTWKLIFETAINLVSGAWTWLKDGMVAGWDIIRTAVFDAFNFYVDLVKNSFQTVVDGIGAGWNWMKDTLSSGWSWIRDNVFSAFTNTIESVKDRFSGFVDALGNKWSGLKSLLAKPINFMINTVYNDGILRAWNIIAGILPGLEAGSPLAGIPEHATGGRIKGPGTGTSDDVLMWGSNGEHMLTAREVQDLGGHSAVYAMRNAVDSGKPFTYDGKGGLAILPKTDERAGDLAGAAPGLLIPGFKDGGEIRPMWEIQLENGHRAAKMRNGNPYTWGFEDCSGYMSAIADAIINGGDGVRKWATGSFPGGQPWVPGLGQGFSVGVHDNPGGPGGGHTAGTLTGVGPYSTVNVESGGGHGYVAYGGPAAGADSPQFQGVHPGQFHLAIGADGAFESGGGGGFDPGAMRSWISEKLGGAVDTIMDPIVSLLPEKPPEWQGIPRGVYDSGRDGLVEGIADGVAGLADGLATVWNAVRNIPDLVRNALDGGEDINKAAAEGYHNGGLAGRGQGLMAKTAMEPEMVLNPSMTKAFISWMDTSPESMRVMAREIGEAFNGGDWGYGELSSVIGDEDVAKAIVNGAAALGDLSRAAAPILADAGKSYAASGLDLVGLGGAVDIVTGVGAKIQGIANLEEVKTGVEEVKKVVLDPDGRYSGAEIENKLSELGIEVESIKSELGGSVIGGLVGIA